jgi:hypothetical protein
MRVRVGTCAAVMVLLGWTTASAEENYDVAYYLANPAERQTTLQACGNGSESDLVQVR